MYYRIIQCFSLMIVVALSVMTGCKAPEVQTDNSNTFPFVSSWRQVDSLVNIQQPESALAVVEKIKYEAVRMDRKADLVRAVLTETALQSELKDDPLDYAINTLLDQVGSYDQITDAILWSKLGEYCQGYINKYRYRLLNEQGPTEDSEYSLQFWQRRADSAYIQSVSHPKLSETSLVQYKDLLRPEGDSTALWTSLLDVLLDRSIRYFSQQRQNEDVGPEVKFESLEYLNDAGHFLEISVEDSSLNASIVTTIQLYQRAISSHMMDGNEEQLVDWDLRRLKYVHDELDHPSADSAYLGALDNLAEIYSHAPAFALIVGNKAEYLVNHDDGSNPWQLKEAYQLCQSAIEEFPGSYGAKLCRFLSAQITQTYSSIQIETVEVPGKNLLTTIQHRNHDSLYLRIYKVPFQTVPDHQHEFLELPSQLPLVYRKVIDLPSVGDFRSHRTEVAIPALEIGNYLALLGEKDIDSIDDHQEYSTCRFQVSTLAYSDMRRENERTFIVFDRGSGSPVEGASVNWFNDSGINNGIRGSIVTDKDGIATIPAMPGNYYQILVTRGADSLWLDDNYYDYRVSTPMSKEPTVTIYPDRSVYRPGQTVFFKGIIAQENGAEKQVLSNKQVTITLYDANGQKVESQQHVSNRHGSFTGNFLIPEGVLTGTFSIRSDPGGQGAQLSVEAYKRPGFEVEIKMPMTEYVLGDTIEMEGVANTFSGLSVKGATGTYLVTRQPLFWWHYGYRQSVWPPSVREQREVASGTLETDDLGEFRLSFPSYDHDRNALFSTRYTYRVTVHITDVHGETQTGEVSLNLGDVPFSVDADIAEYWHVDSNTINITALNFARQPVEVHGKIRFRKILDSQKWKRERYWEAPDQPILQAHEFDSLFPHYKYRVMSDSLTLGESALELAFTGTGQFAVDILEALPDPGYYLIEISAANKDGKSTTTRIQTVLVKPGGHFVPKEELLFVQNKQLTYEAGDTAELWIGSPEKTHFMWSVERATGMESFEWQEIDGWTRITLPIRTDDRGGVFIHLQVAYDNRIMYEKVQIHVPWSDKVLSVNYIDVAESMKPGEETQIRVSIDGDNFEPGSSEALFAMYDASLDKIRSHSWKHSFYSPRGSQRYLQQHGYRASYPRVGGRAESTALRYPESRYLQIRNFLKYLTHDQVVYLRSDAAIEAPGTAEPPPPPVLSEVAMEDKIETKDESEGRSLASDPAMIRENFNETVFFYPQVEIGQEGDVILDFTINEALTTWKLMGMVHSSDMKSGYAETEIITRKNLMITTNSPRFLRSGDRFELRTRIDNETDRMTEVQSGLILKDASTGDDLSHFVLTKDGVNSIDPFSSATAAWTLEVPESFMGTISYQATVRSGTDSDGEKGFWPVLTTKTLVTETRAISVLPGQKKQYTFDNLTRENAKQTKSYGFEFVINPSWYALQAMPSIISDDRSNIDQLSDRLYVLSLGKLMVRDHPDLVTLIKQWQRENVLNSPLEEDLASLNRSPWVNQAADDTRRIRALQIFTDANRLDYEINGAWSKLRERQRTDGGFAWFPGGRSNRYMTQYVIQMLLEIEEVLKENEGQISNVINRALSFLDQSVIEDYRELVQKQTSDEIKELDLLSPQMAHFLWLRSRVAEADTPGDELKPVLALYGEQALKFWPNKSLYVQSVLTRYWSEIGNEEMVGLMLKSFRERLIADSDSGVHWNYDQGYSWHQNPLETHVAMMEIFRHIASDAELYESLKVWLLNQKRAVTWPNARSTAAAIRALAQGAEAYISARFEPVLRIGEKHIELDKKTMSLSYQPSPAKVNEDMSTFSISSDPGALTWGTATWEYFQDLNSVEQDGSNGQMQIEKYIYKQSLTDDGTTLESISDTEVSIGDQLIVEMVVSSNIDIEFVHIGDMRPAGLEPTME